MKNFYYFCVKEDGNKRAAFAETFTDHDNIAYKVKYEGYVEMWPCATKRECKEAVRERNEWYSKQGNYIYQRKEREEN